MPKKPVIADFNREIFDLRLKRSHDDLFGMLERLYSRHRNYEQFLTALDGVMRRAWAERSDDLKRLDLKRDLEPDWFQRSDLNGYVFYIDRFAGDLKGVATSCPTSRISRSATCISCRA